jgi:F-type H+-transporting ATPase subunit b|mmetsp:Transcript_27312/g.69520  ORF Transcript_27312/g.69520 Transcript_27312/m.69520 type:complete len:177 (-) Transcript_27312:2157-2687(-)
MDLLNQTLDRFSTQIAEGVSFNPDIFEANLVNLIILVGGLFYLLSGALSESLSERQQKIVGAIQESEERLEEATKRLTESETQLAQAQMVIESIGKDAEVTAKQVKSTILTDGKTEIERLTAAAKGQIGTIEARVRKQISDYVVTLALKRITMQLEGKLTPSLQQQIIDRNISKLA